MNTLAALRALIGADTVGLVGGPNQTQQVAGSWAEKMKTHIGGISFAGIEIGALAAAQKFEAAAAQISRATGATGEQLKGLEESFAHVYQKTAASSEQVSQALALISSRTNLAGEALEGLTLKMLKLAKTQNEDIAQIAPLVTRVFGDWSIATERQGKAMDFMRVVSQQTGTQVGRLAEQVVYAGAPLRQLGYSFEQSVALLGKFEKEGVNTELVLGGMKAALQKFAKDGVTDTAAAWKEFVDGVRSGAITMQDVMKEVGAKRGVDLFRAITEARFEIDKLVTSTQELADKGAQGPTTLKTKFTILAHEIETVVAKHRDLVMALGFMAPVIANIGSVVGIVARNAALIGPAIAGILSNPVLLALAGGAAAAGIGISQLREQTAGLRSLDSAFGGWIEKQVTGAKTAADLARAEEAVNKAMEHGLLTKDETAKALQMIAAAQTKAVGKQFSLGLTLPQSDAGKANEMSAADLDVFKARHFDQRSLELEQLKRNVTAAALAMAQWEQDLSGGGLQVELDAVLEEMYKMTPAGRDLADVMKESAASMEEAAKAAMDASEFGQLTQGIRDVDDMMRQFGLHSTHALQEAAKAALEFAEAMEFAREQGYATDSDVTAAAEAAARAHKQLQERIDGVTDAQKKSGNQAGLFGRQVSTVLTDLSRELADVVMGTRSIGDAFASLGKAIVRIILEDIIKGAIGKLMSALGGVFSSLGGIGKTLGGIFGGVPSVSGAIPAGAGGVPSSVWNSLGLGSGASSSAGAAGSAASAGVSGVMGIVGAVGSAVSAVSSIVGNFQMSHMSSDLQKIEKSTRYMEIMMGGQSDSVLDSLHIIRNVATDGVKNYWGVTVPYLQKICAAVESMDGGGGRGLVSFSNCTFNGNDPDAVAAAIVRQARLAGASI